MFLVSRSYNVTTIDVLPDTVLLEVLDAYRLFVLRKHHYWLKLAHVCRRWRELVLSSPSRLHLSLYCTGRHARDLIDHFPALPLIIEYFDYASGPGEDILYALQHGSRARKITLRIGDPVTVLEALADMGKPAEGLEDLSIYLVETNSAVVENFLGGHAPRLRNFRLDRLTLTPLSTLLSPMPNLVSLDLHGISSADIHPDELLAQLSAMLRLENLYLHYFPAVAPSSQANNGSLTLSRKMRLLLPKLSIFKFAGHSEWLEGFVDGIDPGAISNLGIQFYNEPPVEASNLGQFIARSEVLHPTSIDFDFYCDTVSFNALTQDNFFHTIRFEPPNHDFEMQMAMTASVCRALSSTYSSIKVLRISYNDAEDLCIGPFNEAEELRINYNNAEEPIDWRGGTDPAQWHALLSPFHGVQRLALRSVPQQGAALWLNASVTQELPSELLPELVVIVLEYLSVHQIPDLTMDVFKPFLAERERVGRPVYVECQEVL
ncbi:hypothetical protein BC834DRAFT_887553 [Gloeopeniophorella convolvens]|nr:hypothetical protein BC834DRAFT_887553 [Gloeopeniophorella convolvens]